MQILDSQKESFVEVLKHFKPDQQSQQVLLDLLNHLKENQNHQYQCFTDLSEQIRNLIQHQNNLISGQLLQQQQNFQTKLMSDLAKQTEEKVKQLLQTSNACEMHETSDNTAFSCTELLESQKESFVEVLKHFKTDQQTQQVLLDLLNHLKENQNHQHQCFTNLSEPIKNLIQHQNNFISGQLLQQQQDFQTKLMSDLAKQTEEKVKQLLQTSKACETHQTSCTTAFSQESISSDPPQAFSSPNMAPCYSQDQERFSGKSTGNFKVQNRDMQRTELFHCEPLGLEFCNVFYSLWNSQNPSYGQTGSNIWGAHLFWENATAKMITYDNTQQTSEYYEGFQCVSDFLLKLTKEDRLEFRPSIDNERFKCVNSKHGLVVVAVTGTILREGRAIGIFEQTFGLIQNTETNHLKMKFTNLKTQYNNTCDAITAPILEYTTEQLETM